MPPASRHQKRVRTESLVALCDRAVTGLLIFLVVFAPFAFGSVHPQAYGVLEIVACLLVLVWVVKLRFGVGAGGLSSRAAVVLIVPRRLWVPLAGFLGVVVLQVVPLPPALLGVLSPSTYATYELALPGWPEKAPYEDTVRALLARDDAGVQVEDLARPVALPAVEDAEKFELEAIVPDAWGRLPGEPLLERNERMLLERWVGSEHAGFFASWRTLSLDPQRTFAELLKILAYLGVFAVVTFYPFEPGSRDEQRFQRRLLQAVAFTAIAVAAVGLLQRFSWNGKILWFFVPWDWGEPRLAHPQTSGPFVSRNNFGGYLALTIPLVLAPLLARTRMDLKRPRQVTQIVFGLGAAICGTALFFSLSRGSWGAAAISLLVFLFLLVRHVPAEKRAAFLGDRRAGLRVGAALVGVMLLFVLLPTGGAELGSDIDRRLEQTVSNSASWDSRLESWRDSLPMIADYPAFGVGLASWGVAFPQYDESFFFGSQARRAHNDYIQIFAETGILGGLLLLVACLVVGARFLRVLRTRSDSAYAVQLAIAAGLLALLIHEFVDFDLQMPAIAMTAVLLIGVGLRGGWRMREISSESSLAGLPTGSLMVSSALAAGFLVLVFAQSTPAGNREAPRGMMAALRAIERFPVDSPAHLNFSVGLADLEPELARSSLDSAVALNPNSPGPRDARALLAARNGNTELALEYIEESMYRAPSLERHPLIGNVSQSAFLSAASAAWGRGLQRASLEGSYVAASSLAKFESLRGNYRAAAGASERAASMASTSGQAASFLRRAGWEMLRAQDLQAAEALLRRAVDLAPADYEARTLLIRRVFGPQGRLDEAEEEARTGLSRGADEYEMRIALAAAARYADQPDRAKHELVTAAEVRPSDVRAHAHLGVLLAELGEFQQSVISFRSAIRIDPRDARLRYLLGRSAEQAYLFAEAITAFERAVALDSGSQRYRTELENLRKRAGLTVSVERAGR